MRFIATADFHLGESIPGIDRFKIIQQIFTHARKKEVDFLIIVGDIYDHLMISNLIRARFNKGIKSLSREVKIILIPGNHDVGRKTTTLSPIQSLVDDRIRIVMKPLRLRIGEKKILIIPYMREMDTNRKHLSRVIRKYKGHYDFVFGHFGVNGVKVGPSNFVMLTEIGGAFLRKHIKTDYFILGHIHKPQMAGNIVYCGSPDYLDFGERKERKRFIYFDDTEGIKGILLNNKSLCQIEVTSEGFKEEIVKNGIYKIVVSCRKDEINSVDVKAVVTQIKEEGGSVIKINWKIQDSPRRRAKLVDFRKSLKFNIKEYINNFAPKKERKETLNQTREIWNVAFTQKRK